jgi:hypothetical protein
VIKRQQSAETIAAQLDHARNYRQLAERHAGFCCD